MQECAYVYECVYMASLHTLLTRALHSFACAVSFSCAHMAHKVNHLCKHGTQTAPANHVTVTSGRAEPGALFLACADRVESVAAQLGAESLPWSWMIAEAVVALGWLASGYSRRVEDSHV